MTNPPAPAAKSRSRGWVIGRLAGAPVIVTPSWFLAAVVLTFIFTPMVQRQGLGLGSGAVILVAFAFVLLLFVSVFFHEAAHAVVARRRGHEVTELAMTLWGGHTAYTGAQKRVRDGALIAVVGPLTNLVLAGLFWLAFDASPRPSIAAMLLYAAFYSNVFVGLFNLLPGLPLDGGQLLEALVWRITGSRTRGTVAAGWIGRVVAVGVLAYALLLPLALGVSPSMTTVVWSAVVGSFLWSGASEAMKIAHRRDAIGALSAAQFAGPVVVVPAGSSVAQVAVAASGMSTGHVVVADASGAPLGWVDSSAAMAVPHETWPTTPVEAVLVHFPAGSAVEESLEGAALLEHLAATSDGARLVPLVRDGRATGVLDVGRVAVALRGRQSGRPQGGNQPGR